LRGVPVKEVNRRTLQKGFGERWTSRRLLKFKRVATAKDCEYELLVISYFF
jgi:hypothetical protein